MEYKLLSNQNHTILGKEDTFNGSNASAPAQWQKLLCPQVQV